MFKIKIVRKPKPRQIRQIYREFILDVREYKLQTGADSCEARDAVRNYREFLPTKVM